MIRFRNVCDLVRANRTTAKPDLVGLLISPRKPLCCPQQETQCRRVWGALNLYTNSIRDPVTSARSPCECMSLRPYAAALRMCYVLRRLIQTDTSTGKSLVYYAHRSTVLLRTMNQISIHFTMLSSSVIIRSLTPPSRLISCVSSEMAELVSQG